MELLRTIAATPAKNLQSYVFDRTSTVISRVTFAPGFILSFCRVRSILLDFCLNFC
jgi:hypothetical protein